MSGVIEGEAMTREQLDSARKDSRSRTPRKLFAEKDSARKDSRSRSPRKLFAVWNSANRDLGDFVNRRRLTWKHPKLSATTPSVVVNYPPFLRRPPGRRSLLSVGVQGAGVNWDGGQGREGVVGASGWRGYT